MHNITTEHINLILKTGITRNLNLKPTRVKQIPKKAVAFELVISVRVR